GLGEGRAADTAAPGESARRIAAPQGQGSNQPETPRIQDPLRIAPPLLGLERGLEPLRRARLELGGPLGADAVLGGEGAAVAQGDVEHQPDQLGRAGLHRLGLAAEQVQVAPPTPAWPKATTSTPGNAAVISSSSAAR